jgi:class 3 adenylate cyclase
LISVRIGSSVLGRLQQAAIVDRRIALRRILRCMNVPRTRYAVTRDGVNIAYQAFGDGSARMLLIHPWISNVEVYWERRGFVEFVEALAQHGRVAHFDKRGTGLSDRLVSLPTFEARLDDILGVLDALGWERAALLGDGDGAPLAAAFAATHPDRCQAIVLEGDGAFTVRRSAENPSGVTAEEFAAYGRRQHEWWGDPEAGAVFAELAEGPGSRLDDDPSFGPWFAKMMRHSIGRGDVELIDRIWFETDASGVIDTIGVPTALYYRSEWEPETIEACRRLAARIPGAVTIEVAGGGWPAWSGRSSELGRAIGAFVASVADEDARLDRVLATVLFTDIVGSTERLARDGDQAWRSLSAEHLRRTRSIVGRHRGREIDAAGDGIFAAFDGPGRAIKAGLEIVESMRQIGLDVRAGLHTGELVQLGGKVSGLAVHIGARVAASAGPGEVRVTGTVKDLVAGAGFEFADLGESTLKGIPDPWRLYRASDGAEAAPR